MKTIYLIRHSAPFVEIYNYEDYNNSSWKECNKNMILSVEGEENAKKICNIEEMKKVDDIYSSNSFRAIGTAKYLASQNNLKIKLDDRINERELGVNKISELPNNFTLDSFNNKDLKVGFGESLNEVDKRLDAFLKEILLSDKKNIALFIHGIMMLSFLQNNFDFNFDGLNLKLSFNNKIICDDKMKNPMIFKITFDDNKIVNIEYINI